jgi:hypothetical protein
MAEELSIQKEKEAKEKEAQAKQQTIEKMLAPTPADA